MRRDDPHAGRFAFPRPAPVLGPSLYEPDEDHAPSGILLTVEPFYEEQTAERFRLALAAVPGVARVRLLDLCGGSAMFRVSADSVPTVLMGLMRLADFPARELTVSEDEGVALRVEQRPARPAAAEPPATPAVARREADDGSPPLSRPPSVLTALLDIHREREPRGVLYALLRPLSRDFGRATICCYLRDRDGGRLRLVMLDDDTGEAMRTLRRAGVRPPAVIEAAPVHGHLAGMLHVGVAAHRHDAPPPLLTACWGETTAADLCRALAPHRYVLAPVQAAGAVAGLVLLMASDGWPAEAATETVAHAAVAIGRLVEQGAGTVPSLHDAESGLYAAPALARLGAQELERAARYHRPLSLAVFAVTGEATEDTDHLAQIVTGAMRLPDRAGRLDDGRLAVVLPETRPADASGFVRRVRERGQGHGAILAGVAGFPDDGPGWDDLARAATGRLAAR